MSDDVCMRFPLSLFCRWDNRFAHPDIDETTELPLRCRLHDRALFWAYRLNLLG